ncbi:MAG: hypothetical protein LLF76_05995 [Planctomycetaceae bacterium]|nr:hypothetical protein [Planctomycetaceae bacterium]
MKNQDFQSRHGKRLEDLFFHQQDQLLIEQFHRMEQMKKTKECLSKVSGIKDDEVLNRLMELDIPPQIAASLAFIPLIEVAWADGKVEEKERGAVLKAASKSFFAESAGDMTLLAQWLSKRPPRSLLDAWTHYMEGLCQSLTPVQREHLKQELIGHARQVAEAAGGFLGLTSKISEAERKTLEYLESVFD